MRNLVSLEWLFRPRLNLIIADVSQVSLKAYQTCNRATNTAQPR